MAGDQENQPRPIETPESVNLFPPAADPMQMLVNELILNCRQVTTTSSRMGKQPTLGGRDLKLFENWLSKAHTYFRDASNRDLTLTLASEWVLDNYYIIRQAVLQIGEDLPPGYYKQLPKLAAGSFQGLPRIYGIARAALSYQNHLLNVIDLQSILIQLQQEIYLSMGEIWALPIFLRYCLIETLADALVRIIHPQSRPDLPPSVPPPVGSGEAIKNNAAVKNEAAASAIVANIILSLRTISEQDWSEFFESVSCLEQILNRDPAEIYPIMDFKTRDSYRKEIEALSIAGSINEDEVAQITLDLALANHDKTRSGVQTGTPDGFEEALNDPFNHIGEYLLGKGRLKLEEKLGVRPDFKTRLQRWGRQKAKILYLSFIFTLTILMILFIWFEIRLPAFLQSSSPLQLTLLIALTILLLIPFLTVSASLVNWLITLSLKPHPLSKLHFKEEVPAPFQTLVVIPTLIGNSHEVDNLVRQLEMHYLRNSEAGLFFALLSDFKDAQQETLPEDEELVAYANQKIEQLNIKYGKSAAQSAVGTVEGEKGKPLFYLIHRKRLWNPSENRWMGWERKRGKLHELNVLLRGEKNSSFIIPENEPDKYKALSGVRFVITLDSDTVLPRGAARRLAGTLAHPLNRARFNDRTNQVLSGYTVLQPRMEIHPRSANHSWFTKIFAGDTGLDLYTRAVSDAYQDLFGEGSYVGKGIYDVDAFERSVDRHIPENSVLSHDLLEGIMGRAGLVTDITMVEDYPPNYIVQIKRQQRWTRGDWQLLPWLLWPGKFGVKLSILDRWKILDNLLRAMVAPALLLIFALGSFILPDQTWLWAGIVMFSLAVSLLTSAIRSVLQILWGENILVAFNPLGSNLLRWALAVAFLPYEAYNVLDAIFTTLFRLFISHKDLLEWTTAAQTARLFGLESHRNTLWIKMIPSVLIALIMGGGIQLEFQKTGEDVLPTLAFAAPVLLLWLFSPFIVQWINQPILHKKVPLTGEQSGLFRQVARRTWGFFERFVGPEDHWLPPDHYQESPVGIIAHHTSPSNIGLLLTSTLAAYDLGYLNQLGLAMRLTTTMETLSQLERFRGHFLNWYDTLTLQPLHPKYLSTVDSGNLAASLIIVTQACKKMADERVFRWDLWQGYLDTLANLTETLTDMRKVKFEQQVEEIDQHISVMRQKILVVEKDNDQWYALFQEACGPFWDDLSKKLMELVEVGSSAFDLEALRKLHEVTGQVERHHLAIQRTLQELVPWIGLLEQVPDLFKESPFLESIKLLRAQLSYNPPLGQVCSLATRALGSSSALRNLLDGYRSDSPEKNILKDKAFEWLHAMDQALNLAVMNTDNLLNKYDQIAAQAETYVAEMDFKFLYHSQRRVFHNGFNLDAGQLDNNYYDLLASEARIASIIALAKGEVPQSHWMQLSRPLTKVEGLYVLLSWSATMFEYLMPPLFLRSYPGTLLADSTQGAVMHQIAYGKAKGVPWGISEAGFYRFDANQNYQYRAFGVPGLGFKRGLGDDLVIAPYASLMAISYNPHAVAENLAALMALDSFGLYGLYESIDFTADRLLVGDTSTVVHEYMAHHQGMILMALANYFHGDIMIERMHNDPRIQSVDLLLQEQIPQAVPLQNPFAGDVKGITRLTAAPVEINAWSVPVHTAIPQVNLLSNGNYGTLLSNMGSGYSTWRGIDLTRWQADGTLDNWGTWIYIQDMDLLQDAALGRAGIWSAGYQPIAGSMADLQVTFFAHMAVFRSTENEITSTMEVTVYPDDPVEIRRIHLLNHSPRERHMRLTSYGEVILTQQVADGRHPAFNKLFIESEFVPEFNLQIFTRRPRSADEKPVFLGHMMVLQGRGDPSGSPIVVRHEADRGKFIGRGRTVRNPAALFSDQYLSGTSGATLDPIFALGQEVEIDPHESLELAYMTFAGDSRGAILALARRYSSWSLIERSFHQANIAAQTWLGKQNFDSNTFKNTLQVLSALIYPFKAVRTAPEMMASNRLGQSGLWRFGISGDYPIILVELEDPQQIDLIREVIQVHEFLSSRRFMVDVVILNHQQTEYGAELNGLIYRLISHLNSEQWLNQRGGIFILYADQINPEELVLLQTAGRFLFTGKNNNLDSQMPGYPIQVHHLPEFIPTRSAEDLTDPDEADPLIFADSLAFFNGYGGFSRDGREYVIELPPGKVVPAPWVNVVGYPGFGFMVSETGSQTTWALNSGENRLTPWFNDPVSDPSGETLYLRDEVSGEVWTPTPLPAGANQPYRVRHGAGYTIFEHNSHGLKQRLTIFASPEDPVKIIHLRVENTWNHNRRITATQYIEWVLGAAHAASMQFIIPEFDQGEACLLASNPYNVEFGKRTAFLIASKEVHGLTADRTEFIGRGGSLAFPAALRRMGLESRLTPGEDPCAVLQLHIDLIPGGAEEVYFVLGQGTTKEQALALAKKYHDPSYVGAALERTHLFWDHLLNVIQVKTPEPAADLILNRWMLYQSLSCRIWGRSAFYQPSGAFGFRDQLQDVLALLPIDPEIARGQILNAAQRQFAEGDVEHWWHPPSGRGVRTRMSDDLLWLPYVTALYIESTGDQGILDEKISFLEAPMLNPDENERYSEYQPGKESWPLLEHCYRAIEKGITTGAHGLPLIGGGDWNDGFNKVGEKGQGESVWLAWFLCDVLERFAKVCEARGENERALDYRQRIRQVATAVEQTAWDGAWYRRASYDDGAWLGSNQEMECQIDAIAQSWSVLSGVGDSRRSRQAMQSVLDHLVLPQERLSLLFTPPFDKTDHNPGYIKGYLPGTRENGGQYTHAAVWTAWAFASLGDGKQAGALFDLLNPVYHSDTREKADVYRVEPYVICADIYSQAPYLGRGGWTWYTGSAAWMYRLGVSAILGFNKQGNTLVINPAIPPEWDGFEIRYQFEQASYLIQVKNPEHVAQTVRSVSLDGQPLPASIIPLLDDGMEHLVEVVMGNAPGA